MSTSDTIKVAIRFRGKEHLKPEDTNGWSFEGLNEVTTYLDGGKSEQFTFDKVLKETS
jgi:hypothetical protein